MRDMKFYMKALLLLVGVISFSPLFAQHGRYGRRYYDNDYYAYNYRPYDYRPYGYAPLQASVSIIARLPFGALAVTLGNRHYHYFDGLYYEPLPGGYAMVEPPVGIVVPVLPPNSVYVIIGGRPYYRYESVYYLPLGENRYQVVPAPGNEGSQAATNNNKPSEGYEKFVLEGKTYYKKGGKYYKARIADNGEIVYEEVGETSK